MGDDGWTMKRRETQATTIRGYDRLIERLGGEFTQAAAAFQQLRQRLVRLLAWRGTSDPEALADETLERVARQLGGGLEIKSEDPFRYAARVAQLVAHEDLRALRREQTVHKAAQEQPTTTHDDDDDARMASLESCLEALPAADRELILTFYRGEKGSRIAGRRALAARLGISVNALRIRAYRLRQTLEQCIRDQVDDRGEPEMKSPPDTTERMEAAS